MSVVIRKKTTGLTDFFQRVKMLNEVSLTIGFQGARAMVLYPNGSNVATIAAINEFKPRHSFMRSTMFENRDAVTDMLAKRMAWYLRGKDGSLATLVTTLSKAGQEIQKLISDKIRTAASWAPQNSQATIARKGENRPLIDTTRMLKNLSWAVRGSRGTILATNSNSVRKR